MTTGITVVKISGHCLDNEAQMRKLTQRVAQTEGQLVIVHGGGSEITRLQERLGITPRYVDGLRVTDADSLKLVEMALCGTVNKRLTRHLLAAGVDALGMSGVDRGLVRARKVQFAGRDMGFTGEVACVRAQVLRDFFRLGVTPVIAPVSVGECGNLNLNADMVAGAIGAALRADTVVFVSNVPGVRGSNGIMPTLTAPQAERLIAAGVIHGGMIPKVKTALDALSSGVTRVIITDQGGWINGAGTSFVRRPLAKAS